MKSLFPFLLFCVVSMSVNAQVNAALFRFPDVSTTQIVFTYANDLWLVPKTGGTAIRMSAATGVEAFPKFSPDGSQIAFTGNYDGNADVYLIPAKGGIPKRLTFHSWPDRVTNWLPNGDQILFASGRESEKERYSQLYTISPKGGQATKLPLAYGEFASYSADGKKMALVFRSEAFRTWKRYRGGDVADIYIYDFEKQSSENISGKVDAGEEFPMWSGNFIYFLSDQGAEKRMNLWKYDVTTKQRKQITQYKDTDVHFPSLSKDEIVYENGGKLYLLSLKTEQSKEVPVQLISDQITLKPRIELADKNLENVTISPDGNRVIVEARGDIFTIPAEFGFVKNLSQSSEFAERDPAWSPDGKYVAFWSDRSGEYELWLKSLDKVEPDKKLSNYGPGFRYHLYWSHDSKKLAFIDKAAKIRIIEIATSKTVDVDQALSWTHGNLQGFTCSWSPDDRWLAYHRDMPNQHNAAFIYDTKSSKTTQITSGYYDCSNPIFDPEGKYIYVVTNQSFQPTYSDIDNTFIYTNTNQIAAISLLDSIPSLTAPKNDKVEVKADTTAKKDDSKKDDAKKGDKKSDEAKVDKKPVNIDLVNIENRMVLLPIRAASYFALSAIPGKIMFMKGPPTGAAPGARSSLRYYDID
ncbi:MAG: peptidase S41, partial [Saprospiraceae bacterium]